MSIVLRKMLPTIILSASAVWMILEYFTSFTFFTSVGSVIRNFVVIIAAFAVALGGVSSIKHHLGIVIQRKEGAWFYSAVLLVAMVTMTITGLIGWFDQPIFSFLWNQVTVPCQQTVYSLLMFYVATAAYRALRATSNQAIVFMIFAIIIMLTNGPLTEALIPGMTDLGSWVLRVPNTGSARGFLIAANIGIVALYTRIILGKETGVIGSGKED